MPHQEPFTRVALLLGATLLFGAGGGFALLNVLILVAMVMIDWQPMRCNEEIDQHSLHDHKTENPPLYRGCGVAGEHAC